jgi:hypothetical protein
VGGDLFNDFDGFGFGVAVRGGFGEVEAGNLEAVEEQAGAAGIDVVGGDAAKDFADDKLNAGAIVEIGEWDFEGGVAAATLARVGDRAAGGVVVVAEVFSAQAGAAAAVAVCEDVTALVLFWCVGSGVDDGVLHVSPHWVKSVQSLRKKRPASGLGRCAGLG